MRLATLQESDPKIDTNRRRCEQSYQQHTSKKNCLKTEGIQREEGSRNYSLPSRRMTLRHSARNRIPSGQGIGHTCYYRKNMPPKKHDGPRGAENDDRSHPEETTGAEMEIARSFSVRETVRQTAFHGVLLAGQEGGLQFQRNRSWSAPPTVLAKWPSTWSPR